MFLPSMQITVTWTTVQNAKSHSSSKETLLMGWYEECADKFSGLFLTLSIFFAFLISWIFSSLPSNKQMMAFSATYPEYLATHLTRYMREPTFVRLNATDPTLQGMFFPRIRKKNCFSCSKYHNNGNLCFHENKTQIYCIFFTKSYDFF